MGYRPDNQSIETPSVKIIEGVEDFREALLNRTESGEWSQEHLDELEKTYLKLRKISRKLEQIKAKTW